MDSVKVNLPPHLQERMEKLAEQQSERLTSTLVDADSRARHFKAGYQQAYSDIMQELGPVIQILRLPSKYYDCEVCDMDPEKTCLEHLEDSERYRFEALKHLKERILNVE